MTKEFGFDQSPLTKYSLLPKHISRSMKKIGSLTELSNNDVMSFIEYSPPSSNKLLTFC